MFSGDGNAGNPDFAENQSRLATRIKDVSPEEVRKTENARHQTAG